MQVALLSCAFAVHEGEESRQLLPLHNTPITRSAQAEGERGDSLLA
jgi:hypothetical protein